MTQQPPSTNEPSPAAQPAMLRYLLILIGVPLLLCLLPFWIVRLPAYRKLTTNFNFPSLDFGFKAAGQNADIVIYGDSSATHGIDPRQMESALHLRVLDIPGNSSLLSVTSDLPLRHYLRTSTPPRLIVLYFAPWDLDYTHQDFNSIPTYDGLEILMRNGSASDIAAVARRHPLAVAEFPLMFYSLNVTNILASHAASRAQAQQVATTNGYTDFPGRTHYPADCQIPAPLLNKIHFDSVREMATRFETPKTKVLIYIAPIPACTNAQTVVDLPYQQLPAAPPKIMPTPSFGADQYYTHLYPEAVPASTENLIEATRPLLTP